jgi:hypothetical protein
MTTPGTPRIEQPFSPNKVGGSSAKLMLVTEGMEQRFRKEERRRPSKLKAQYEWLHQRQGLPHIPKVFESVETPQSFSYEMRFYGDSMPLVTWIHQHSQEEAEQLLLQILKFVHCDIHRHEQKVTSRETLERYLLEKVEHKLLACAEDIDGIRSVLEEEEIWINGEPCLNLFRVLSEIRSNDAVMKELSTYVKSPVHGDLTVENILVTPDGDFLLLDPNNENWLSSPLVDYAKLYQSLHSGYEFMEQTLDVFCEGNRLQFEPRCSPRYSHLFQVVRQQLSQWLSPMHLTQILFHEAVHFARMLPYKARSSRPFFWVFYARMVWLFNEFSKEAAKHTS